MGTATLETTHKHAPQTLGRVLILGLGKSGQAAARYCANLLGGCVHELYVAAGVPSAASEAFARELAAVGATVAFGDEALQTFADAAPFDICIASPGISELSDLYLRAQSLSDEIMSEVEFAWRESAPESTWIAISGTNGKTTVTSLIAHLLQVAGQRAAAVGNIGDTCLDAVAARTTDVYVAEVSSYQLASTIDFAPRVAVLLGITPDHLIWHGSYEAYQAAKFKLFANVVNTTDAFAILDATNDIVRARVRQLKAIPADERGFDYVPVGTAQGYSGDMRAACGSANAAFVSATGTLTVVIDGVEHELLSADELQIVGEHNVANALMAASAVLALGVDAATVARGLASFAPLEHRIEPCGVVGTMACYNDSKATNVDATLKALNSFPGKRVCVLLGGRDKMTELDDLVAAVADTCVCAICYGEARERFYEAFAAQQSDSLTVLQAEHMSDAFELAVAHKQPLDVLLLSPACASFDEFSCFEERGDTFKALVAAKNKQ